MIATVSIVAIGCGKKGPPLAPIVHIPAAVQTISTRRLGSDVFVTLTVPEQNIDTSKPADVSRIDLFGYTGTAPPPRGRFLDGAVLVATVPVALPPTPGGTEVVVAPGESVQGAPVTIRDALTPDELIDKPLPPLAAPRPSAIPTPATAASGPLRRFYMAIAFNDRGRNGPPSEVTELPLTLLPEPPVRVDVIYTADTVMVSWEPSGGLIGFLLDQALTAEPPPFDETAARVADGPDATLANVPPGPTRYNIYRDVAPDPLALPSRDDEVARAQTRIPVPVNTAPLDTLTFNEPVDLDERDRCYAVRAVRGLPPNAVEGDPSAQVCVTPIDVFPPSPPASLSADVAAGTITLSWEPNADADLAGYVVLRGEAASDTLTPLTGETPIAEAKFIDDAVTPGVRYVYEVIAVDGRVPLPNTSVAARIEETAR